MPLLLSDLFKAVREAGSFSDLMNVHVSLDSSCFLLKSGDVMIGLQVEGKDAEGLEPADLSATSAAIQRACRVYDENCILTIHTLKREAPPLGDVVVDNPIAQEAIRSRNRYLNGRLNKLYEYETYITIALRPGRNKSDCLSRVISLLPRRVKSLAGLYSTRQMVESLKSELAERTARLHRVATSFLDQASDSLRGRILPQDQAMQFFRRVVNPSLVKGDLPVTADGEIDFKIVDSVVEVHNGYLAIDDRFVKVATLKLPPKQTHANLLGRLLRVPGEIHIVSEWSPVSDTEALSRIGAIRRHLHITKTNPIGDVLSKERLPERERLYDESKEALVKELGDALTRHATQDVHFQWLVLTIAFYGQSLQEVDQLMGEAMRYAGSADTLLNEERYGILPAYLATLPGGHPYAFRKLLVTDENSADLTMWFQPACGERKSSFLASDCLAVVETEDRSPFFYNIHVHDVGHTAIFGSTGSGKTFWLNFLLTHAQQYGPYTFIFDVGGSYRWLTELFGGSYISFGKKELPFQINPCCLEPTKENLNFLQLFFKLLIESGEYRLSDSDQQELFKAIRALYVLEPEHRRLLTLAGILPPHLSMHLRQWIEGGQYGHYFDNASDTVTFNRFQCIDFEGMEYQGLVVEALVFYLLHRVSGIVYDPSLRAVLKIAAADETSILLHHPEIRTYIERICRTWRKHNGSLFLATQSLHDFPSAETMRPIIDNCPTKIFLANPTLDGAFYGDVLKLSPTEQARVRSLIPKRQLLLKREGLSKVLNLNVDPRSYWLFTTNPFEAKRREDLVAQVGLSRALDILTGESK